MNRLGYGYLAVKGDCKLKFERRGSWFREHYSRTCLQPSGGKREGGSPGFNAMSNRTGTVLQLALNEPS
jgi:hypothetical protein